MPLEWFGQRVIGHLDVDDAAVGGVGGFGGGVEGEGVHEDDVAGVGFEGDGFAVLVPGVLVGPVVVEVEVGAGDAAEGAVGGG